MNCNVTYLDYSSQRLVSKSIICNIGKYIPHIDYSLIRSTSLIKTLNIVPNVLNYTDINGIEYYRINLQHNGEYNTEWNSEELLNHIGSALFIIVPKINFDYDNMKILLDKPNINTTDINNTHSNINVNININDKFGIINLINKHINT